MIGDPERLLTEGESRRRASFLELFFDVVFVFALTRISARAAEALAGPDFHTPTAVIIGVAKAGFLLLALWTIWQSTAWSASRYDPCHGSVQLVIVIALVASTVLGVSIPHAFSQHGLAFAVAYVVAQVSRPLVLALALRGERQMLKLRMLITFSVTAVAWIAGGLLDHVWRGLLWALALGVENLAGRVGWPVPGLGRSPSEQLNIAGEHLAERYQQFFLIALGEAVLATGLVYSNSGFGPGQTVAFAAALATALLIWRIYFYRAGQVLPEAVTRSREPARMGLSTADSHLIMLAGIVTSAVGFELAIGRPTEQAPIPWIGVIFSGPALFAVGRTRFEYEVFSRVSPSHMLALVVLAALFPVMIRLPPLVALATTTAVLAAVALIDVIRSRKRPPEPASPPL